MTLPVRIRYTVHKPPGGGELQRWAEGIAAEYMEVVTSGIAGHERSAQKLIGPSEIGVPCERALLHKLNQDEEPFRGYPWKPTVGTALHSQMEVWFLREQLVAEGVLKRVFPDWRVEEKVAVGTIGTDIIYGSTDIFNENGAVGDHKFVGTKKLKSYKADGPGQQYRTQAHCYGRGWALRGFPVHIVMIVFLPRDGELEDTFFWWEPYDESVALAGLARANNRYNLIQAVGIDAAAAMYPLCGSPWCVWCNGSADGQQTAMPTANPNPFRIG